MQCMLRNFNAWRVQKQTALYSVLLLANPSIQRNLRMMSVQDQEETDPLSFTEAQQAWIERLVAAAKISEAASTSTATSMSDIAVSSGASVVSTSSGTTVTAATTAVHGGIGEYSSKKKGRAQ